MEETRIKLMKNIGWGKTPLYSLKTSTLKDFNTSIPLSNLTQSFRDAIEYTRRLRCRYIWIDSLCIIQDSLEDWERESMQMLDVYSNAWLTIAVTGFPDGLKGMFSTRPPNFDKRLPSFTIKSSSSDTPTVDTANYSCLDTNQWTEQVESAPLNRRGWVVQERVLSPRILHFGKSQIFWECNQNQASETYATGLPHSVRIGSLNKTDRGVNTVFPEWKVIIEAYSHGALTKQTDKLVAISGIARAIERNRSRATTQKDDAGNPRKYIGGLWSDYGLPDQLGWSASVMDGGGTNCTRLERYTAPTWSWACLNGAITWSVTANSGQHKIFRATTIPTVYTSPRSADEYGPVRSGVLTATGPLRRGVVFHSPQNFPAKVERYSALIAGELVELELRPDASLPGLPEIADLRLPPMDLISESSSSGQGGRRAGVSESLDELELYLLPNKIEWDEQRGPSTLSGLWLQSTNRGHAGRGEYARLGLFLMYSTADKQVWEAIEAGLPESVQNLWTTDDLLERCRAFMSLAFPIFAGFGVKQMFAENEYVKTAGKGSVTIQII